MSTSTVTAASTSKLSSKGPLRRRMHLLQRAHSFTNLGSTSMTHSSRKKKQLHQHGGGEEEDGEDLSPLEYESETTSSESEHQKAESASKPTTPRTKAQAQQQRQPSKTPPPIRPRVNTNFGSPLSQFKKERSPLSPNSRSWYEFDLAVVVALVSPIGNWLTGGDHIKNLLLVVLLIFYLHQIIEIPWSLYHKARPRKRSPQFPPDSSEPAEVRYAHLAAAELRRLELFFLFCTLVSPICGAFLLRYATAAVLGQDAVSWFSTGLFVLATGMRPWAHLVDRLNERTVELHDYIHYPETYAAQEKLGEGYISQELEQRIASLEKTINKLKTNIVHATEEVYEYVDDSVDAIEVVIRKQDTRLESHENKALQFEKALAASLQLQASSQRIIARRIHALLDFGWATQTFNFLRLIPLIRWPLRLIPFQITSNPSSTKSPSSAKARRTLPSGSPLQRSPRASLRLDSINEQEEAEEEEEKVLYESYPILIRPLIFASSLVSRCLGLMMLPFKAVVRMVLRRY